MKQHDLEIEIGRDGRVKVKISGAKGKSCLEYAKFLQEIVGKLQKQELTAEYYEPEEQVRIDVKPRVEQRQKG
jgi:hypothetical protein